MNGVIFKGENPEEGIEYLNSAPSYDSLNLAEGVSNIEMLNKKYGESNSKFKIAVIDCGVKENILKLLSKRDCSVKIFSSDFELEGQISNPVCVSARTQIPRNIKIDAYKNTLSFNWSYVKGALAYNIYRDEEKIAAVNDTSFQDVNLAFDTEYYYKISAIDALNKDFIK